MFLAQPEDINTTDLENDLLKQFDVLSNLKFLNAWLNILYYNSLVLFCCFCCTTDADKEVQKTFRKIPCTQTTSFQRLYNVHTTPYKR